MKNTKLIILLSLSLLGFSTSSDGQIVRNSIDNTVKSVFFADNQPSREAMSKVLLSSLDLDKNQTPMLKYANVQADGSVIERYVFHYQNHLIEHSSASAVIRDNKVGFINANVFKESSFINTGIVLTEAEALQAALHSINAKEYMWESEQPLKAIAGSSSYQTPAGTLVWVEDFTLEQPDRKLHLAYKFDIYAKQPESRDAVFIDAATGKVLLKDPLIKHISGSGKTLYSGNVSFEVATIGVNDYQMYDSTRDIIVYDCQGGTAIGYEISNSTTIFPKSVANDVHWATTKIYDYWKNVHNRTSFDNSGSRMISFVNFDVGYNNASWNGANMRYGNGTGMFNGGFDPLVGIDVCAHEIGHAICQYTAGLLYQKESGAMNEGFSDIWGAVIEYYAAPEKSRWTMGEEFSIAPLRSMQEPHLRNNPDTHGGNNWTNVVGCTPQGGPGGNDYCGVHNNSSVLNFWFYLLTEGGVGVNDKSNAYEVAGIGIDKAAELAYATEQVLTNTATYADCRNASINIAANKYGACSREVEAVTRAWYAVGVGAAFAPCNPQIGFGIADTSIEKMVSGLNCNSKKGFSIPLRVTGNAPAGGNATVTIKGTGTAKDGADYEIITNTLTFNAGSTATQQAQFNLLDNGDIVQEKTLKIYFAIAQNGSNAITSYTYDTCIVTIKGNPNQPDTNGAWISRVNKANTQTQTVTPFYSRAKSATMYFIITADEMRAAGVRPNEPITAMEFNVTEKNSTLPFDNFVLKADMRTMQNQNGGYPNITNTLYNNSFSTNTGWNRIPFSTGITWNGTDNMAIGTCFANSISGSENDFIEGIVTTDTMTRLSPVSCASYFWGGGHYASIVKPIIRLVQPTVATEVEQSVVTSRDWDVNPGQNVIYRNNTTGKLITGLSAGDLALGCVHTQVTQMGTGVTPLPAPFAPVNRTKKEFAFNVSKNGATAAYDVTLYYDTAEFKSTGNVRMVATSAANESLMDTSNTRVVVPTVITGQNHYAFKARIAGFYQKYFIIDDNIVLPTPAVSVAGVQGNKSISVVNNPFHNTINISYNLLEDTKAVISLYDVTGKRILHDEKVLSAKEHMFTVNAGAEALMPGHYILRIVTSADVITTKMLKQ